VPQTGKQVLLCIDKKCSVHIFNKSDLQRPKTELTEEERRQFRFDLVQPALSFDLLENCQITDYHQVWVKDSFAELISEHGSKEGYQQNKLDQLKNLLLS